MSTRTHTPAAAGGGFLLGGDRPVNRLGFGAMRLALGGSIRDPDAADDAPITEVVRLVSRPHARRRLRTPQDQSQYGRSVLAPMTRQDLDTLDDQTLITACLSPVIARIRGRGFDVKSDAYLGLASPQRALLAFHVLHGHAHDVTSFWWHVRLFATEWNVWTELEDSARYFADDRLLEVYRELSVAAHAAPDRESDIATALYHAYHAAAGDTLRVAADHIRAHPDQFVDLS